MSQHHLRRRGKDSLELIEEAVGLLVVVGGVAANDFGEVGRKIGLRNRALQHVLPWNWQ